MLSERVHESLTITGRYGNFLKSQINKKKLKIVEITDKRSNGLLKSVIDSFGKNVLFVNTLKGFEDVLEEHLDDTCTLFTLSEDYFRLRLDVKDMKGLTKLVKQFVNELLVELKITNSKILIIYRANDLPPFIFGMDHNLVIEEFWRLLTADLRSTDCIYMFVYEEVDYQPDILSHFADVVLKISSLPQLWSIL